MNKFLKSRKESINIAEKFHEFSYRSNDMESPFTDVRDHLFLDHSLSDFLFVESTMFSEIEKSLNEIQLSKVWRARATRIREDVENLIEFNLAHKHVSDADYLCIGCSCTTSYGLPFSFSWPMIIKELTGKKVNNFGKSGTGIHFQCALAIASMRRYGKPVNLFALFPDVYRMWMPSPDSIESTIGDSARGTSSIPETKHRYTIHSSYHKNDSTYKTQNKNVGHKVTTLESIAGTKHTFPPELPVIDSIMILKMLEEYCSIAGINFVFTSWSYDSNLIFNSIDEIRNSKSYKKPIIVDSAIHNVEMLIDTRTGHRDEWLEVESNLSIIGGSSWRKMGSHDSAMTCNHEPQTSEQAKFWHVGSDSAHPGFHDQIHYAEHFIGEQIDNDLLRKVK
jgi:hypothetical protein